MNKKSKSIFFVGHEAYRTGAPLLLLSLVKWIDENLDYRIYIFLITGGPLIEEYKKFGKVIIFERPRRFGRFIQDFKFRILLTKEKPEFVYFNTVVSLKFFYRFRSHLSSFRKVLHIHEMPFSITQLIGKDPDFKDFFKILVVNQAISNYLEGLDKKENEVMLTPEYIDAKQLGPLCSEILSRDRKTILGVGVTSWRKGFDYFLQTAAICKRIYPGEFYFVWVGPSEKEIRDKIEYEVQLLGLTGEFTLIGESKDVKRYYSQADLFFLTSREDPYPLVMLEAAFFKIPVLYFAQTGGAEEFFNFKPFEIPYGDCLLSAFKIKNILNSKDDFDNELESFKQKAI